MSKALIKRLKIIAAAVETSPITPVLYVQLGLKKHELKKIIRLLEEAQGREAECPMCRGTAKGEKVSKKEYDEMFVHDLFCKPGKEKLASCSNCFAIFARLKP